MTATAIVFGVAAVLVSLSAVGAVVPETGVMGTAQASSVVAGDFRVCVPLKCLYANTDGTCFLGIE